MNAQSKIRKNKNVVQNVACIVAHPDDEVLGVGGTLLITSTPTNTASTKIVRLRINISIRLLLTRFQPVEH